MDKRIIAWALAFAVLNVSAAGAVSTDTLQREIDELRESVESIQRRAYGANVSSQAISGDAMVLLTEQEETARKLNGRLEALEHRLKGIDDKIDLLNKDIDMRLKALELGAVSSAAASADVKASKNEDAKGLYEKAHALLKEQKYAEAEAAFAKIVKNYPKDALAGNSQYWVGESFYARHEFDKAAVAFAKGYEVYKDNPKAADSLLKLGMAMNMLKNTEGACAAFLNLPKEFPKADAGLKERAGAEAKKLECK